MHIGEQVAYLRVADVGRSFRFYCDGLGFEIAHRMDDERGPFFARLEKDGLALMIANRPSRFLDFAMHAPGHFHEHDDGHEHFHGAESVHDGSLNLVTYLYVADVEAAYAEVQRRGIEPLTAPEDMFYGVREFLVRDPDNYYYAIAQRLP